MEPRIWLIGGPTASGKSALALALAEATGGELVNADSMQLYRDLRVLTARPSAEDEVRAPHHLFGVADAADAWSAGRWLRAARETLTDIAARRRAAIVVGGTGLYFRVLTEGLAPTPPVSETARQTVQARFDALGEVEFRHALAQSDPISEARIATGDRQRLVRAMTVLETSGRPLSAWRDANDAGLAPDAWRAVALTPPREALYARIDARLQAMIDAGALDEVRTLLARGLDPALPAMKSVGVRELAGFLSGETGLEAAVDAAQRQTRRYAKRQLTWIRNQTPDWPTVDATEPQAQWDALRALAPSLTP